MSLTLHTTDTSDEGEEINIITSYYIERGSYDPNTSDGRWPSVYIINHIWYGNIKYPDLESLALDYDEAAREIRRELEAELNYFNEEEQ